MWRLGIACPNSISLWRVPPFLEKINNGIAWFAAQTVALVAEFRTVSCTNFWYFSLVLNARGGCVCACVCDVILPKEATYECFGAQQQTRGTGKCALVRWRSQPSWSEFSKDKWCCGHALFHSWRGWTCWVSASPREESSSLHLIMLRDTVEPDIWELRSGKEICFDHLLYRFV